MLLAASPGSAAAQGRVAVPTRPGDLARADALLRAGRVDAAEALYYREVRRRPRDPAARLALGRYLASRGATKIGTVLIEEARFFGANPVLAAIHLAPLYVRLGDYKALTLLPATPLSLGERARAQWLAKNPPAVAGPDSVTLAMTAPESDSTSVIGTVEITVDGRSIVAEIDPTVRGLVLDTATARTASARVFEAPPTAVQAGVPVLAAVLAKARLGPVTFTNLPVDLEPLGSATRARIGLDLLGRFAPTFHPHDGRIVLRRSGKLSRLVPGERLPLLLDAHDAWVVWAGRRESLGAEPVSRRLRGARWTLDSRRGAIVLER